MRRYEQQTGARAREWRASIADEIRESQAAGAWRVIDGLGRGGKRRGIAVVPAQVLRMFVLFVQLKRGIVVDTQMGSSQRHN